MLERYVKYNVSCKVKDVNFHGGDNGTLLVCYLRNPKENIHVALRIKIKVAEKWFKIVSFQIRYPKRQRLV